MASTTYYADIQKLYVAYFNRPADVAGLQHWEGVVESMGGDTSLVSAAFAASNEYKVAYAGKDSLNVVATVYQNLFGHAPDQAGLFFWADKLNTGVFTVDQAVTMIAAGAQGSDKVAYDNKVAAATAFTNALDTIPEILGYSGDAANARAKLFISGVTTDASLAAAIEPVALNAAIQVVITPPAPPVASYTLAAASAAVDEGKTVFFNLDSTNAVAGSEFSYSITGVDAGDIVGGLTGTVKLDSAGKAVIAVTLAADARTEGLETLTLNVAGKSAAVGVNDVSLTPGPVTTYNLSSSVASVDEGGQVTFRLDTTGVAAGTVLSYQITGIDASRINGATSGQVTVDANGQALVIVKTVANQQTDGASSLNLSLVNGAASATVAVNDTSLTSTVFTVDSAKIVASNNTNSPVVVTTADTGTATVNITSTSSLFAQNGIVIEGDADLTINMGSTNTALSSETVYVTGTGANTVVFARDSSTSVVLGDGDDTVQTNNLTMVATQSIDFGAGEDTLDVNGVNNFSTGSLSGVEHVTMHSSAIFSAAQLADIETITELGTDGTLTVVGGAVNSVDLTGKLFGEMALVVGTGVTVTLSAAELANITAITTSGTAVISTTVAGAQALLAVNAAARYSISDTAENLANAPAAVFGGSGLQEVEQAGAGTLSIAQAMAVHAASPNADFTVSATADELVKALVFDSTFETLASAQATIVVNGPVDANQASIINAAGLNTTFVITDTAQHVADVIGAMDADMVTGLVLSGTVTAAGAGDLVDFAVLADITVAGLNIVDDFFSLMGLSDDEKAAAASIRLDADEVLDVDMAVDLKAELGAKLVGGYNLSDSAAALVANAAIAAGANDIEVDGIVGVAVAGQLSRLGNSGSVSYELEDSAANLANATATVLANASEVTVQGTVTLAQANVLVSYAVESFELVDTAANVLAASAAVIAKATAADDISITDAFVTAATGTALFALDAGIEFNVVDTAAALLAADVDVLAAAGTVTVSGTVTAEQGQELIDLAVGVRPFALSDTVDNILAASNDVKANVTVVSASGTATIAEVVALKAITGFDGKFAIVDTAANVATLAATGAVGIAVLNASTAPVVVTGTVNVATATLLEAALTFTNWSTAYDLVDSYAALSAATPALRAAAVNVFVQDSIATVNTNFAWINANADGYVLVDTVANLIAGGNAIVVSGAESGQATGIDATAAQAATLFSLNADIEYDLTDTALNLVNAANADGVRNATEVAITGTATVAQVKTIVGLHAVESYNLSDNATNLAAVSAAATVAGAENVSVTGTATAAQAGTIVNLFDGTTLTLASITDTVAAIQAAAASTIIAANALVVTDGTRLHLSAAELAHFGQAGGVLTGVTTTAVGASSDDVHFDLIDTLDNLVAVSGMLADAGKVTVLAGGEAIDVAVAAALIATLDGLGYTAAGFNVTGTAAALVANDEVTEAAASVTVTGAASAADAAALLDMNVGATFEVSDTVTALTDADNAAAVAAAEEVTVTGTGTVAKVSAILALNADADIDAVVFADTAANLANAPAGMIDGNTLNVTTPATAAQFNTITAVTNVAGLTVTDTAANMVNVDADMLASRALIVNVSTPATAAQAEVLTSLSHAFFMGGTIAVSYTVTDSVANIIAFTGGLDDASSITVTGSATAAQAVELANIEIAQGVSLAFDVSDTAENLLDIDNRDALGEASTITVTGDIDVATAALLDNLVGGDLEYTIVDTLAHLIEAAAQTSGGIADAYDLNSILGNAESVTIIGGGDLEFVNVGGHFVLSGNIAELKALPADLLDIGYVVEDTVAHIVADFGFAVAGETGYSIVDSAANILAAATSLVGDANTVTVTGTITAANATAIRAINGDSSFDITDSVTNLVNPANSAAALQAGAVVATGNATAAQGTTLAGFGATFTVSDSAANLLAGGNAAGLADAASIAVTGATTSVAQITLIKAAGPVTSYNLTDTAANLAASAALVAGATAVVAGTANGIQAAAIYAAKPTAVYSINDSVTANLFTGNVLKAAVGAAVAVNGTLVLNVAQAQALGGLGDKFDGTFSVVDTAAAVAAAGQALLDVATGVTVTGDATAAQATAIAALTFGVDEDPISVNIVDSAANLLLASNAAGIAGQDVTVTGTVSVATATQIDAANTGGDIHVTALSDTSTNLQLGSEAVVNGADSIHVTDTQTVAQAIFLAGNVGAADEFTFARISDTLSNVMGNLALALTADVITTSGSATIAQSLAISANAELSSKLSAKPAIADTVENVLDAYLDQDFKALVTSAPSITITDDVSATQAVLLQGFGNVAIGALDIVDTIGAINGLSAGLINLSDSVTVLVDTDLARQQFSDAGMLTSATIVYSNGAALNGTEISVTAPGVYNSSSADILTLKAGDELDLSAFGLVAEDGDGIFESGEYMIVRGNVSNGGNTFTQSGTGTSTMVIFDADTGVGVHSSGIILVGQSGDQLTIGAEVAGDLSITGVPPGV